MRLDSFDFRSFSFARIASHTVLVGALCAGLGGPAQATKRGTPEQVENRDIAVKTRRLDGVEQLSADAFLQDCIETFVQARQQGNSKKEEVVNRKLAAEVSKNIDTLLVQPEHLKRAFRLLAAMQNAGVEEFVGSKPSVLTTFSPELMELVLWQVYGRGRSKLVMDGELKQSRTDRIFDPQGVRDLVALQRVNKYFEAQVVAITTPVKKFYVTDKAHGDKPEADILPFRNLKKVFPSYVALTFSCEYFHYPSRSHLKELTHILEFLEHLEINDIKSLDWEIREYLGGIDDDVHLKLKSLRFNWTEGAVLDFLDTFPNLTHLDLTNNPSLELEDLSREVYRLEKLTSLELTLFNRFKGELHLSFLKNLPSLEELYFYSEIQKSTRPTADILVTKDIKEAVLLHKPQAKICDLSSDQKGWKVTF
jgi:hypothetical protein